MVEDRYMVVNNVVNILREVLSTSASFDYIYSDKNIGPGVHLYFPNIIVTRGQHKIICQRLRFELAKIQPEFHSVIDLTAQSGLKLLYQGTEYYKINFDKSDYLFEGSDLLSQFRATCIRATDKQTNCEIV